MPLARSPAERKAAIESLFRVRAVETPLDEAGEKSVWHQGTKGADLLSIVNRTGHVIRQELTLFDDYFLWTKQHGLRTGQAKGGPGSQANKASDDIRFDRENDSDRLDRALEALDRYKGEDKYLIHARALIKMAIAGAEKEQLTAVTNAQVAPKTGALADAIKAYKTGENPVAAPPPKAGPSVGMLLGVGFAAGLVLVLIAWLMIR